MHNPVKLDRAITALDCICIFMCHISVVALQITDNLTVSSKIYVNNKESVKDPVDVAIETYCIVL